MVIKKMIDNPKYSVSVRNALRHNYRSKPGIFISSKIGRPVKCESKCERAFFAGLEINKNVLSFCEQPRKFGYLLDGVSHYYFPDAWEKYDNYEGFVEVKPACFLEDPELRKLYEAVALSLSDQNVHFRIVTDVDIQNTFPRYISDYLLRFRYIDISKGVYPKACEYLSGNKVKNIAEIRSELSPGEFNQIMALVCGGYLNFRHDPQSENLDAVLIFSN